MGDTNNGQEDVYRIQTEMAIALNNQNAAPANCNVSDTNESVDQGSQPVNSESQDQISIPNGDMVSDQVMDSVYPTVVPGSERPISTKPAPISSKAAARKRQKENKKKRLEAAKAEGTIPVLSENSVAANSHANGVIEQGEASVNGDTSTQPISTKDANRKRKRGHRKGSPEGSALNQAGKKVRLDGKEVRLNDIFPHLTPSCIAQDHASGGGDGGAPQRVILGYFRNRCISQSIRLLLAYLEIPVEEHRYEVGDHPHFDKTAWLDVKAKLPHCVDLHGPEFPNLPYLIVPAGFSFSPAMRQGPPPVVAPQQRHLILYQSNTILRFIAQQISPRQLRDVDQWKADELLGAVYDDMNGFCAVAYLPWKEFEPAAAAYKQSLVVKLEQYEARLQATSRPGDGAGVHLGFFASPIHPTHCDFAAYEFFDWLRHLSGVDVFASFPLIKKFMKRVEGLHPLVEYMKSPAYLRRPFLNRYTNFENWEGGKMLKHVPLHPGEMQRVYWPPAITSIGQDSLYKSDWTAV